MSKEFVRLTAVNEAKVREVIEIKSIIGKGTKESPVHEVLEYYSLDGELLARRDLSEPCYQIGEWKCYGEDSHE